ncbi:CLUMA_CG006409, isoform A [Clunio marinus]|uniref:CLUMA_CG006409, isoform A n=1 Tax=Clunio marinus TaxID=568069 RepID=A0A1J1I3C3_9DIPT|nr:CLUMA_CG006409, isoform A [Clunio marinus]
MGSRKYANETKDGWICVDIFGRFIWFTFHLHHHHQLQSGQIKSKRKTSDFRNKPKVQQAQTMEFSTTRRNNLFSSNDNRREDKRLEQEKEK